MNNERILRSLASLLLVLGAGAPAVLAADEQPGWSDTAELSYVLTAGNARTNTLGFKNKLTRKWTDARFVFRAEAVRAEATTETRFAVGTPDAFREEKTSNSDLTAENYLVGAEYDHKLSARLFWNAGVVWDRNRFAGIESRTTGTAGLGTIWADRETFKFRTVYAVSVTHRKDVTEVPGRDKTFAGLHLGYELLDKFTSTATWTSTLGVDDNLKTTSDWRADMVNALTVAMNKKVALKASLQFLYNHEPALAAVPLFAEDGTDTGLKVLVPLEKLDTIFTTSIVVNF